jgi:hypothetical protein
MLEISIVASQIADYLMETRLVEGRERLKKYFDHYYCLEGKPVIERIDNTSFRLITYYENLEFYRLHYPGVPFECIVKEFSSDTERYLELLRQLFHGKARSSTKDKYEIINRLNQTLSPELIASEVNVDLREITKYIYPDDQYRSYLEYSMNINKRTIMEDVIRFIKSRRILKEDTEYFLLDLVIGLDSSGHLTKNKWNIVKWVLDSISDKFNILTSEDQRSIITEAMEGSMKVLSDHFRKRCNQLLGNHIPNKGGEYYQPTH